METLGFLVDQLMAPGKKFEAPAQTLGLIRWARCE